MKHCKHYYPWTRTSQGEIDVVCVNYEKRTIKRCPFENKWPECPEFVPSAPIERVMDELKKV